MRAYNTAGTRRFSALLVSLILMGGLASTAGAELFTSHVTDSEMLILMPEDELAFTAEGRIGGASTFELDLGRTTAAPAQTAEYGWQSGVLEPFTVSYDAGTNTAVFSLGGVVLSYEPDRYFNEIFVRTRAVDDGSAATVSDIVLEGEAVADLSQATGPGATDVLRISGGDLYDGFEFNAVAVLEWVEPAPTQSRLAFQVKVGAVPASPVEAATWSSVKALYR